MTPLLLLFSTMGACFAGSIIPLVNTELVIFGAAAALPTDMIVPLIVFASLAQMAGKCFLYFAGSGLLTIPRGRFADRINTALAKVQQQRGASRLTIFASAATGLPPFYALSLASGALRVDFRQFLFIGLAGRTLRCAAIVLVPQLIKAAF
ncbi:MAG: hypothetical protein ABIS27_14080 [Longimicrobiales bacterium]